MDSQSRFTGTFVRKLCFFLSLQGPLDQGMGCICKLICRKTGLEQNTLILKLSYSGDILSVFLSYFLLGFGFSKFPGKLAFFNNEKKL